MDTALIGLDPLFSTNVKLFIKDVLALVPTENVPVELFNFYDHIIKFVEICGIVVAVENSSSRILYTVDDGSGTIACCLWSNSIPFHYVPMEIGTAVRVLGKITTVIEERQIVIYDIFQLDDPNEEPSHYIQTIVLEIEYQKPYRLPDFIESNKESLICQLENDLDEEDSRFINFTEKIMQFLQENVNDTFTIWLPREDPNLIKIVTSLIESEQQKTKISPRKIMRLFERAIKSLSDRGLVVKSKKMESMFELVDVLEAENFILEIVSDVLKAAIHQRGGVKMEYIRMRVLEKYKNMDKKNVDRLVDGLFDRGLLYPSGYGEYKVAF